MNTETLHRTAAGHLILEQTGETVLCVVPDSGTPFVVWTMNTEGLTFNGDYCFTLEQSLKAFKTRAPKRLSLSSRR